MKKRFGFIIVSFFVVSNLLLAQNYRDKIVWKDDGYYFLEGFSFEGYKPSRIGLKKRIEEEVDEAQRLDKEENRTEPYTVVGHSQGGLRALAYATHLKKTNPEEYNRLQAVISVSGVVKGLKALEGGFPAVKSRIMDGANTVWRGVRAAAGLVPIIGPIAILLPKDISAIAVSLVQLLPDDFSGYLYPALNGASADSMAEIRDMFPNSNFIKENVATTKAHTFKLPVGVKPKVELKYKKVFGIKIYYPVLVLKTVYKTFNVYQDKPVFGEELPVGYIVGLKSNTLSMVDKKTEDNIRSTIGTLETTFEHTRNVHIVKSCLIIGLLTNSIEYAIDSDKARKWMANFDGELNELKRSTENDGLVAKESQYYPKTYSNILAGVRNSPVHTNVLGSGTKGYVDFPQYNHYNIIKAEDVHEEIERMINEAPRQRK